MIYEVEFTSNSRESARTIAKQLMYEHVLASASITPSDYLKINLNSQVPEIEEQYLVKVKALTTAPKYLMENYKLKNFVAKAVSVDEETAKKVSSWCNEETETLEKPAKSWAEYREQVLQTRTDNDTLCELARTGHPGLNLDDIVYRHEQPAHEAPVLNQDDARLQFLRHNGFTMTQEDLEALKAREELTVKSMTDIIEETTTPVTKVQNYDSGLIEDVATEDDTIEDDKKDAKIPQWAKDEGMTYTEYKKCMNERTAARWGLTYPEYSRLAGEARKNNIPLKEYFEQQGLTYSEDFVKLENSFKELEDAERAFINWLKITGLPEDTTIDTVFDAWCTKYGLNQQQRAMLRGTYKGKEDYSTKIAAWAEKLGLTMSQYGLFNRMGAAAGWGLNLDVYDSYYYEAKRNGMSIENELAAKYTKQTVRGAARHFAEEFKQMQNYINKLQELYANSSDNHEE